MSFFFFKQKTAYEMRISDWSSDVCSSDLIIRDRLTAARAAQVQFLAELVKVPSDNPPGDCQSHAERAAALLEDLGFAVERHRVPAATVKAAGMIAATNLVVRKKFGDGRSEEHTSELQSLMRISYAVFCLKKKKKDNKNTTTQQKVNKRVT